MIGFALALCGAVVIFLAIRGFALLRSDPLEGLSQEDRALIAPAAKAKRQSAGPITALARRLSPSLAELLGPGYREAIDRQITRASSEDFPDFTTFMEIKTRLLMLGIVATIATVLVDAVAAGLLITVFLFFLPDLSLISKARERQEAIDDALPDFLDVLAVTVSAGLSFRGALDRVTARLTGPLSDEIVQTLRHMDIGESRYEAFRRLRARNASDSLDSFVTALLQSEELGAPLSEALEQIAVDMRRVTSQRARTKASRANPQISAVVTLIMVPGTLAVMVVSMYYVSGIDFNELLGGLS